LGEFLLSLKEVQRCIDVHIFSVYYDHTNIIVVTESQMRDCKVRWSSFFWISLAPRPCPQTQGYC